MGDGVIYEDDDVRISVIHPGTYGTDKDVAKVEITDEDRAFWEVGPNANPALSREVSVTMPAHQWAGVLAMIRGAMAMTPHPGLGRLAHDTINGQVREHLGFHKPRQDADGHPEGEK